MSRPGTVERIVADTARPIEEQVEGVDGFQEWVERHGLGRADEPEAIVARQAAFHIVLVSALYESYRSEGVDLPELEAEWFHELVEQAYDETDDESFAPYFLTDVANVFPEAELSRLLDASDHLVVADDPAEVIGRAHESLVPQEDRRKLGQFRTPPVIADLMAEWVVRDADDVVLDPGVGAAALSTSAYAAKQSRGNGPSLEEIVGIDVSELSVLMANTALRLSNDGGRPHLQTGDFFDFDPADLGEVDAVISNPPYTRHHELDEAAKAEINRQMEREGDRSLSSLSPLYAYFYVHAPQFLTEDGRTTFITPSEFLETNYGEDLKAFLLENYHLRAFVLYDREADSQFDEALTTSFISFLERKTPGEENDSELTKFVRVDEWPGRDAVLDVVEDGTDGDTEWGFVNTVRQAALDSDEKWDDLYNPVEIGDDERLVPFEELATVNRGIATGMNSYFCLTEDERTGASGEFEWEIDEEFLSPLVRNSGCVPHYDYREEDWERQRDEGEEVWLLYHLENLDWDYEAYAEKAEDGGNSRLSAFTEGEGGEEDVLGVVEYLKYGMSDDVGAHESYLARNRSPWFVVDRREPAPILYTYMSRSRGRFVHNETNAGNLNNLHSVYLEIDIDEEEVKALLAYLNSPFADEIVKRSGRTYSTGMDKVEPAELESVPVLDPRELSEDEVERLGRLFDELCEASRDGGEADVLDELSDELDGLLDV